MESVLNVNTYIHTDCLCDPTSLSSVCLTDPICTSACLQRPFQSTPQYGYTWSPPTQSNETSNGYFLERSHSALMCLEKADELCPEEVSK